ncbi:MAG: hypothetical protein ACETVS_02615 [Dehalococcoidales bacterium]
MEEIIKRLLNRFWPTGVLFLFGFLLIVYIAFGILYLQQTAQQRGFEKQISKLSIVVARPLPSGEKLQTEYDAVNRALAPITDKAAVALLVGIAAESGIDIDPASGNFRVPSAKISKVTVGGGSYKVWSFSGVRVQSDYDNVMAFISDLDSGKTLGTMVLKKTVTNEVEVMFKGEEGNRRAEFRNVASAVTDMMDDNGLLKIICPMDFEGGVAINLMGDDPDTEDTVEGFPDNTFTAIEKGYSGNATPRDGYVLYNHDKITDNNTQFETVSYINVLTTEYYYTCEADGTVRQFDGANVATATEYLTSAKSKMETVAIVDVDIYTKLE